MNDRTDDMPAVPFDSFAYVKEVGAALVRDFSKARQFGTTPVLKGNVMEQPTRDSLAQLLPGGLDVGSGCIIDSEGRTSRQIDVVIYERAFCPVFCVNNSPETTYYPCEGVLAVGEVKSTVGKSEFDDAVKKMESVKALKRQFRRLTSSKSRTGYGASDRNYGGTDNLVFSNFDPEVDSDGDIVGFLLTDSLNVGYQTVLGYYQERKAGFHDILISLAGQVCVSTKARPKGGIQFEPMRTADSVVCFNTDDPFGYLVLTLQQRFRSGKTAELEAFDKYVIKEPSWTIVGECQW